MTDPIKNLIAAGYRATMWLDGKGLSDEGTAVLSDLRSALNAIAAAEHAAKPVRARAMQIEGVDFFADPSAPPEAVAAAMVTLNHIVNRSGMSIYTVANPAKPTLTVGGKTIEIDLPKLRSLADLPGAKPEPKRDRLPPKFWALLDELKLTGDRRAYEALEMLGTAIESVEVRP